ncbi:nitrate/nitrite transport system permease protein [Bosea lathyri]|uniref:Nitrate/nitrite transport system permease protein n=2 Tax=Bosea lathyri TaxID=1036778 RepID=A0A1H6CM76_9HYPH|nr:nitrate/nitrite transport system permease protein [Bosea lathyri]
MNGGGMNGGGMTGATEQLNQGSIGMGQAVLKSATSGAKIVALPGAKAEVVTLPGVATKRLADRLGPWLRTALVNLVPPLITVALILLVWQLAAHGPQSALPTPTRIWAEARDLITEPFFWNGSQDIGLGWRILVSLQRVAIGFSLAAVVGVLLGALVGQSVWAMRGLDPVFQVLRTVPPLAWLPLSLAAFRDSQPSAIFVIFITAIWPVIINTAVGIRNIPQDYRNVAQVLRLNQIEFFFKIMVPSAAPYIFTGLRIGVGLSWLAIVAAEMLTGGVGIGFFIWDAWNSSRLSDIIVALVYIGVVGFILDRLVAFVGTIVTRGTLTN